MSMRETEVGWHLSRNLNESIALHSDAPAPFVWHAKFSCAIPSQEFERRSERRNDIRCLAGVAYRRRTQRRGALSNLSDKNQPRSTTDQSEILRCMMTIWLVMKYWRPCLSEWII